MSDIKVYTLYSGSSGNCVYISSPGAKILIDAGKSARTLAASLRAAGGELFDIDAIFVTHGHSDHTSALAQLMRQSRLKVHMTEETAAEVRERDRYAVDTIETHPRVYETSVGDLTVRSFATSHDSPGSVGYIVSSPRETLGIATDLGYVTRGIFEKLSKCDRVIIESNYDPTMLRTGSYPYYLKQRISSDHGHLSNDDCARVVSALADAGVRSFLLAHLSAENNTPEKALAASCRALVEGGHKDDTIISVADRHMPTFFE